MDPMQPSTPVQNIIAAPENPIPSHKKRNIVILAIIFIFIVSLPTTLFLQTKNKKATSVQQTPTNHISQPTIIPLVTSAFNKNTQASPSPIDTETLKTLTAAHNSFGFTLLKNLYNSSTDPNKNIIISPTSIELALTITYQGSDKETKKEMKSVLGFSQISDKKLNNDTKNLIQVLSTSSNKSTLSLANSLWISNKQPIKQPFIDMAKAYYDSDIKSVNFDDQTLLNNINSWVSDKTKGKINNMLTTQPPPPLVIINTLYFDGAWEHAFDPTLTKNQTYTMGNGLRKMHPMMNTTSASIYLENSNFQAIKLSYYGDYYNSNSMYIFLPKKQISQFISLLSNDNWNSWLKSFQEAQEAIVNLTLPKYSIDYDIELKDPLKILGIKQAFDANLANFSQISSSPLYIGRIIHKTRVEVEEKGTKAAASTVVLLAPGGGPGPDVKSYTLNINKPFYFAIVNNQTNEILFSGIMNNPQL